MEIGDKFYRFLKEIISEQVYLRELKWKGDHVGVLRFEIAIKGDKYLSPDSLVTLTEQFYDDVSKAGRYWLGEEPIWNNTAHIGWFIVA